MGVKDSTRNGRRDPKCPSARGLRMIREDTGTPNEGAIYAWMAANEAIRGLQTVFHGALVSHNAYPGVPQVPIKFEKKTINVKAKWIQKRILFRDEAHFWLNGFVNKQNCRIWSEANPQVYVETPLHPEKLTVWCALWAGGILLQKR
ncbi:hypothetical protein TNCV_4074341 [Trichonephila clavipes]|uniref:Transposase n=1 Tax=Trichonephila clavipes TaxID=2585209 RepID=A0A8X7BFU6_TRICX|nr:hypothetical protein TNCV_4074341 [Trichonephila clavipes]